MILFVISIVTLMAILPTDAREKPNVTQVPRIKPPKPPSPKKDNSTPVPLQTAVIELPTEEDDNNQIEQSKKVTKTRTIHNFKKYTRVPNYDAENYTESDNETEQEMTEIVINETDTEETPAMRPPKKTIKTRIKKVKDKLLDDDSVLGKLLNNENFMTALKGGTGVFGTLFGVCMMLLMMKMIKPM